MNALTAARHRVAIAGMVTDAATSKAVAWADVVMTGMPVAFQKRLGIFAIPFGKKWDTLQDRPDKTRTRADGLFYFLDLPDGEYELRITVPRFGNRYGGATHKATVARDKKGTYRVEWAEVSLPATTIEGSIKGKKSPISFAQVCVQGSGESAHSDNQGQFSIAGVEPGKRTLLIKAQGYKPAAQVVTVASPGDVQTVNISLVQSAG